MSDNQPNRNIKKGLDLTEMKKNRAETTLQIRKEKKEEQLQKRRLMAGAATNLSSADINDSFNNLVQSTQGVTGSGTTAGEGKTASMITPEFISMCTSNMYSTDPAIVLAATQQFRRILSLEKNPPIQLVIDTGIIPRLVELLQLNDNASLQFEAAWALTNIASGTSEDTNAVISAGAVPIFVQLLSSANEEVREQAAWALGNISGDSVRSRDYVLSLNALSQLAQVFMENTRLSTIRNATWTLSNLCRGKPPPSFQAIAPALPLVARLIFSQDIETVTDACWALSYISDGPNERIDAVLAAGVAPRLVELLGHSASSVQVPALRTVGNIVTGNDTQTQTIINLNAIPALNWLLSHQRKNIRKEACWTLSNITAGTKDQIQKVIQEGCVAKLIEILRNGEFEIQKEAAWAISNATSGGTKEQILYIASQGAIPPLCELLKVQDNRIVTVALEGLENFLRAAQTDEAILDRMIESFHDCDGVSCIENLQNHQAIAIYERAVRILETFFEAAEEEESEMQPEVNNQGQFMFGNAPPQNGNGGYMF